MNNYENKYDNCKDCGEKLKAVHHLRTSPKLCAQCRTWGGGGNKQSNELKELCRKLIKNPTKPSENEMFFEDDPRAEKDDQYGRVYKNSSTISSWGLSPLSEIMTESDTNKYRPTNSSSKK